MSIEGPKVSKFQVGQIQNQMSKKEKESQIQGNPEFFAVFVECKQNKKLLVKLKIFSQIDFP